MHRVVVILVVLAGCVDTSVDPPEISEEEAQAMDWHPIVPPGASNMTVSQSFAGTFAFQDSNRIPERPGQPQQAHDLAALVPMGTFFTLVAEAEADTAGDIDVWVVNGSGEGHEGTCECPFGAYSKYTYNGIMGDRLDMVIQYDETGQEAEFDYTLDVTIYGQGDAIPAGSPLAIDLAVGEAVRFGASTPVAVFDPDDRRVADTTDTYTATTSGEHVVMGIVPGAPFTVETNATNPGVRWLTTDAIQVEEDVEEDSVAHNFTAPPHVLAMQVCLFVDEFAQSPSLRVTGPNGVMFEESSSGIEGDGGWEACWASETGDPTVVGGDYLIEAERERGIGGSWRYNILTYGR